MAISRRNFLKLGGVVMLVVMGGGVWRAVDQGVFSTGQGAAYEPWTNWNTNQNDGPLAQGTRRAIALEDLGGIRKRVTVRRDQRATLHARSGSFFQLRAFLTYKAQLAGVTVIPVDPRHTSRTGPHCGCVDKRNRPAQSKFACVSCGFSGFADHIAARNIASRAVVNPPNVAHATCTAPNAVRCKCEAKAVETYVVPTELRSSAVTSHPVLLGGS